MKPLILHTVDGPIDATSMSVEEKLALKVAPSKNYDYESDEPYDDAKVILGRSNGVINPNETNHNWAYTIYQNMQKRDWVPQQVNTVDDRNAYPTLSDQEKRLFHLVLAQLIINDSVQTTQLPKIEDYITSPVVAMALSRHAYEEANHSVSYAVMESDVISKKGYIYNLCRSLENQDNEEDLADAKALLAKNKAVGDMYASLYIGKDGNEKIMTVEDLLLVMVANQILEELVFPGGFVAMYTLEKRLPGTVKMIEEIHKDESLSHVPLFRMIFRTAISEIFGGIVPQQVEEKAHKMIQDMAEAEFNWTSHIGKDQLGFSKRSVYNFISGQVNSVCKNLGLRKLRDTVPDTEDNPLKDLLNRHLTSNENLIRSNNFLNNNASYVQAGGVKMDF